MIAGSSPTYNDPLLSGFARIRIKENPLTAGKGLLMELGDIILTSRRMPRRPELFQQNGDPVLDKIFLHLQRSRYHIAWKKIAIIGCSAGGNVALRSLFKHIRIPHIPIVITMHHNPGFKFATQFESANGVSLGIQEIKHGESVRASRVYWLPGDKDLSFDNRTASFQLRDVTEKPRFRPDIDKAFVATASRFRGDVLSIIMSGMLNDGAEGVKAVYLNSGDVWIQDPASAMFKDMPQNAIASAPQAKVKPLKDIAEQINRVSENDLSIEPMGMGLR